ncbi:MAG: hypothetical protein VYA51_12715 [Planctomycetota bacterium]|nr:hypothetical protein [Planctomycetota bacterium]
MEISCFWPDIHDSTTLTLIVADHGDPDDAVELGGVCLSRAAVAELRDELSEVLEHFAAEYGPQKRPPHQD